MPSTNDVRFVESTASGVTWTAIIAGAFAAAAVSLLLLSLGSGLGFAAVSPWSHAGASAATVTFATAAWLIVMQWISSGFGGYIAGRLRSKWVDLHTDEVFFRDTAHGFLTWAVATVFVAGFMASAIASVGSGAGMVAAGSAAHAAPSAMDGPNAYYIDSLFRSNKINATNPERDVRGETNHIFARGIRNGSLTDNDKAYLTQLVVSRTGLSQAEASARIDETLAQARHDADVARKTASTISFFTFFSMLIGAFIASVAAAVGGRQRDEY